MIGIYKITNPKGKIYIGQSTNINKRFKQYKIIDCKNQIKLYNSLSKYNPENHLFEILEECEEELLNEKEIYWGSKFNVLDKNGLNLKLGNGKGSCSEQTKNKMRKAKIGKKDSELTKQTKSQSAKGRIKSTKWRQNISNSHPTKKPVEQYSLGGAKINEYISINETARQTGIRVGDISACCNGKQKTAFGFIFKFK